MSEKNFKNISIPIYDIGKQMEFILSVCDNLKFEATRLIPLILADWICTFQEATSKMSGNYYASFISYLKSTKLTYDKLMQIKEYIENGNKSE